MDTSTTDSGYIKVNSIADSQVGGGSLELSPDNRNAVEGKVRTSLKMKVLFNAIALMCYSASEENARIEIMLKL